MTIHRSAIVEDGAELGANVAVGPFSFIEAGAKIGDNCRIGPHVTVTRFAILGEGCSVHAGAVIGDDPQDLGFKGGDSFARIGPGTVIREGVTIHRSAAAGGFTEIGSNCFLMAFSHYAHNVVLGDSVIVANGALLAGHVRVGDRAFISGNVVIHQFVRIGRIAMLGGGAAISKDVPPFCTMEPAALNSVAGLNVVGMRRAGIGPEERAEIRRAFKEIYLSGMNFRQAAAAVRSKSGSVAVQEMCAFIEESKRGICPAGLKGVDLEGREDG